MILPLFWTTQMKQVEHALQTMESLLFQMIGIGLFFLSVSLLSGFIFIEDLFAQHLAVRRIQGM